MEYSNSLISFFNIHPFQNLKPATGSNSRILRGVEPESESGIEPEAIATIPAPEEETVGNPAFYLVDCEEYLEKVDLRQKTQAADEW